MSEMPKADFHSETPQREFWRDLKPIEQVFRPGALPEAYIKNAPTDDERYYVPFSETVGSRPSRRRSGRGRCGSHRARTGGATCCMRAARAW